MKVTGLDTIMNHGMLHRPALYLSDLLKESEIAEISFDIDSYDAGFDIKLENGKVIKIRTNTMPSADTSFYIEQ